MQKTLYFFLFYFLLSNLSAQPEKLVNINDLFPERLETAGFSLNTAQKIKIESSGLAPFRSRDMPYTASWILNSQTREVIWEMQDAKDKDRDGDLVFFEDEITLEAGNYEVYYSTYRNWSGNWHWNNRHDFDGFFNNLFGKIFYDDDDWDVRRRDYRELYIKVFGAGQEADEKMVYEWQNALREEAIFDFSGLRDDQLKEQLFEVKQPIEVEIYALGEARDDGNYDFGWLMDMNSREKIWQLDYRHSGYAGGADKNRYNRETISLNPGTYKIVYMTDDSHSFPRWNSAPPYDPYFWGLTLHAVDSEQKDRISLIDTREYEEKNNIVKFDRLRDAEYRTQGFSLNKPLKLHIYALGEGRDGEMFDYGWIVNAKTRQKVWKMDYFDTENAGGANKNRLFDGTVELQPGNYIAYYMTDGSHSYRSWNSGKPYNEEKWGMTISVLDDTYSEGDVSEYFQEEDESVLVRIARVGDYERVRSKLTLDKDQYVHIYCIGEGVRGEMYDYAWIENVNNGRIVWEMTYRDTERAGGAYKNRLFDDKIFMKAGDYEVFYETDDSHSFPDWNDSPPYDPFNWGITISLSEE